MPTPQGLSQARTSFIGSRCQGIHHVPFIACLTNTQQKQQNYKDRVPPTCFDMVFESSHCAVALKDARVHYPGNKNHKPPPTPSTRPDHASESAGGLHQDKHSFLVWVPCDFSEPQQCVKTSPSCPGYIAFHSSATSTLAAISAVLTPDQTHDLVVHRRFH